MNNWSNYAGGFYRVGDELFVDKIQAVIKSQDTGKFPNFEFHDHEYNQLNWGIEPAESLEQLYAVRAEELRNQYDYLVLHFSGGSDSTNILETFIKNNIHLDEIFIRGPYESTNKHNPGDIRPENQFAEVYLQAVPSAQMAIDHYLKKTKLTIVDTTKFTVEWFANNPDWFARTLDRATPSSIYKNYFDKLNPVYANLTESGKTVGHIYGIDKPMLCYENDQFHVRFLDKITAIHAVIRKEPTDIPYNIEYFYWGASCAKLICKQAHVIKKFIKSTSILPSTLNNAGGREHHDRVSSIIYNRTIFPMLHKPIEKSKLNTMEFDLTYFFNDQNSAHVINWKNGIDQLKKIIPTDWVQGDISTHFMRGIWTRQYCIGS